jgi:alanine racemase
MLYMMRPTQAIVNLSYLEHNIKALRGELQPGTKFMAVVKANAYGHGAVEISKVSLDCGADYLGVALIEEGQLLRERGINAPILVFGGMFDGYAPVLIQHNLVATVSSIRSLKSIQDEAKSVGKIHPIHIKVDTGMNRIGIKNETQLRELLQFAQGCKNILVEGLYTHFAVSEKPDESFTLLQGELFKRMAIIAKGMGFSPILHASNSGGIVNYLEFQFDMVRAGISMYGYRPGGYPIGHPKLQPVLSWKSAVNCVKDIQPGETISYGRTFTAKKPMKVATIPIGYGDGYKRCLSNKGAVLIHGKRAPIIGIICMDLSMCDVTEIPDVNAGDEVVLLGKQNTAVIDADEMASWADTISYEILLSISNRVPRHYVY